MTGIRNESAARLISIDAMHQVLVDGKKVESHFVSVRELELLLPPLKAGTHKITVIDPGIPTSELAPVYLVVSFK